MHLFLCYIPKISNYFEEYACILKDLERILLTIKNHLAVNLIEYRYNERFDVDLFLNEEEHFKFEMLFLI